MRGRAGEEIILCGCARNYSGANFVASIPYPNPIPGLSPCPTGDWVDNLHGSYWITILQVLLQSNYILDLRMRNGFLHICCQKLTQIKKVKNRAYFPNDTINGDNKQRKIFPFLVSMLTVLLLILFFPPIQ